MTVGFAGRLIVVLGMGLAGCSPSGVSVPDPVDLTGPKTWYGSIAPLVAARCGICHRSEDIGPFPLETLEDVQPRLAIIRSAVANNRMPPFPPVQTDESGCPKIDDARQMTNAERALLVSWIDEGAPIGDKRELPRPRPNKPLGDPTDRWAMSAPYTSKITQGDDYRCFLVMPKLVSPVPVAAISVEPGKPNDRPPLGRLPGAAGSDREPQGPRRCRRRPRLRLLRRHRRRHRLPRGPVGPRQ